MRCQRAPFPRLCPHWVSVLVSSVTSKARDFTCSQRHVGCRVGSRATRWLESFPYEAAANQPFTLQTSPGGVGGPVHSEYGGWVGRVSGWGWRHGDINVCSLQGVCVCFWSHFYVDFFFFLEKCLSFMQQGYLETSAFVLV